MATNQVAHRTTLVYGAGAIGCLLGGRLAAAGWPVTLLGRPVLRDAVARHGLQIHGPGGTTTVRPTVVTTLAELDAPPEIVLLTVKAHAVDPSLPDLEHLATAGALIVSLQNGVGVEERLLQTSAIDRLAAGSLTIPVATSATGVIRQEGTGNGLTLAPVRGDGSLVDLTRSLNATGLPTIIADDYRAMKWSKLLLNMMANALPAILSISPAQVYADPQLFRIERAAFREALQIMRASNLTPMALPGFNVPLLARAMALPAPLARRLIAPRVRRGRGNKRPSLQIDIERSGPTEIAWLNGAVARAGDRLGLQTPVNAALSELVTTLTEQPGLRHRFTANPEQVLRRISSATTTT